MEQKPAIQRLRVLFSRGPEIEYISHLDIMRTWERALRRAAIPMAYTQGFNPQPRLAMAAPLAVGIVSEGELMDVFLAEPLTPAEFQSRVMQQAPPGIVIRQVEEAPLSEPSLQARMRFAEYRVEVRASLDRQEIEDRIARLLAASEIISERRRGEKLRRHNIRPLIAALTVEDWNARQTLFMRLQTNPEGAARPDEVLTALELDEVLSTVRLRLILG